MGITVTWNNEARTITRIVFSGSYSITDLLDAFRTESEMIQDVEHAVCSIVVFEEFPMSIRYFDVASVREVLDEIYPKNLCLTVAVTTSPMLTHLLRTIPIHTPHTVKIVTTEGHAYRAIEQHRSAAK
ncbi:MAG: hypothetical protein AAFU54_26550 [Chloroflexota bacterium]